MIPSLKARQSRVMRSLGFKRAKLDKLNRDFYANIGDMWDHPMGPRILIGHNRFVPAARVMARTLHRHIYDTMRSLECRIPAALKAVRDKEEAALLAAFPPRKGD